MYFPMKDGDPLDAPDGRSRDGACTVNDVPFAPKARQPGSELIIRVTSQIRRLQISSKTSGFAVIDSLYPYSMYIERVLWCKKTTGKSDGERASGLERPPKTGHASSSSYYAAAVRG